MSTSSRRPCLGSRGRRARRRRPASRTARRTPGVSSRRVPPGAASRARGPGPCADRCSSVISALAETPVPRASTDVCRRVTRPPVSRDRARVAGEQQPAGQRLAPSGHQEPVEPRVQLRHEVVHDGCDVVVTDREELGGNRPLPVLRDVAPAPRQAPCAGRVTPRPGRSASAGTVRRTFAPQEFPARRGPVRRGSRGGWERRDRRGVTYRSVTDMRIATGLAGTGIFAGQTPVGAAHTSAAGGARGRPPVGRVAPPAAKMDPDMGSAARAEALSPQTNSRPLRAWQQAALAAVRGAVPEGLPGHRDARRRQDDLRPDAGRAAALPAGGRPRRRRLPDRPPAAAVGRRRRRHGHRAGPGPDQRRRPGARRHPGLRHHLRPGRRQADAARRPRDRGQDAGDPRRGAPRR